MRQKLKIIYIYFSAICLVFIFLSDCIPPISDEIEEKPDDIIINIDYQGSKIISEGSPIYVGKWNFELDFENAFSTAQKTDSCDINNVFLPIVLYGFVDANDNKDRDLTEPYNITNVKKSGVIDFKIYDNGTFLFTVNNINELDENDPYNPIGCKYTLSIVEKGDDKCEPVFGEFRYSSKINSINNNEYTSALLNQKGGVYDIYYFIDFNGSEGDEADNIGGIADKYIRVNNVLINGDTEKIVDYNDFISADQKKSSYSINAESPDNLWYK